MNPILSCFLSALVVGCAVTHSDQSTPPQPKIELIHSTPMADPYVFKVDEKWFIFGTESYCLSGSKLSKGKLKAFPYTIEYPYRQPPAGIWGFHPFRAKDGTYHAVGTLHLGYFKTEIAAFEPMPGEKWTADKPITKWRCERVLVPYVEGKMATYETKVVQDTDGTFYLVYCRSFGLGRDVSIIAQRMSDSGHLDRAHKPVAILNPEGYNSEYRNEGAPLQIVEGPNIVKINDYYILLYTVGDFATKNYKAAFAYSKTLIPADGKTYQKVLIDDPKKIWGGKTNQEIHYLVQSLHPEWPNYIGDQVIGPGLLNLVHEDGKDYLVFHGYQPAKRINGARRMLWKAEVKVNVSDKVPPTEWITLVP